jgi:hypothetical protein
MPGFRGLVAEERPDVNAQRWGPGRGARASLEHARRAGDRARSLR